MQKISTNHNYLTIPQVAKLLGISRIALYNKVKQGKIRSTRIGRNFAISQRTVARILKSVLTKKDKSNIDKVLTRTVNEYGEVLRLLGKE